MALTYAGVIHSNQVGEAAGLALSLTLTLWSGCCHVATGKERGNVNGSRVGYSCKEVNVTLAEQAWPCQVSI